MEFKNTNHLNQIDWDTEIANEPEMPMKEQINRYVNAMMVAAGVAVMFEKLLIQDGGDTTKKSNTLRILQYFFAKGTYHDSRYHKRDADLRESTIGMRRVYPFYDDLMKLNLPKSNLTLEDLQLLEKDLIDSEERRRAEDKKKDGGYPEAAKYFTELGLELTDNSSADNCGDRDAVCFMYDDVRYMIYLMKNKNKDERKKDAERGYKKYIEIRDRYHPLIKKIYNAIQTQLPQTGDIWVMSGGGMQLQAFFGNKDGYLSTLYLGMEKRKDKKKEGEKFVMTLNGYNRDELFKDFIMDDIVIKTCFSIYGDELRKY